jgi:predicted nucleic acid-binding protein
LTRELVLELGLDWSLGPLALDTSIFIYWIEDHPTFADRVEPVFAAVAAGRLTAVTSELTLLEVLVGAFRWRDRDLAETYEAFLTASTGLTLVPIDRTLLRDAARLRAATGVKTPDALQLAAGLAAGSRAFLTSDRRLPERVGPMRVVQLVV